MNHLECMFDCFKLRTAHEVRLVIKPIVCIPIQIIIFVHHRLLAIDFLVCKSLQPSKPGLFPVGRLLMEDVWNALIARKGQTHEETKKTLEAGPGIEPEKPGV